MKQLEVTLHLRNNLLKERRLKAGLSQGMLSKYANVHISYVNAAECLRRIPASAIKSLANYFDCEPHDLFPESFQALKHNKAVFAKVDVVDLSKLRDRFSDAKQMTDPERILLEAERGDVVAQMLTTLPEREANILKIRFGLDGKGERTLKETGRIFNVCGDRVRQIEARAIQKLRHPARSRPLREVFS